MLRKESANFDCPKHLRVQLKTKESKMIEEVSIIALLNLSSIQLTSFFFFGLSKIDVDECFPIGPCKNGGNCVNKPGSYECQCLGGYQGQHCEHGKR